MSTRYLAHHIIYRCKDHGMAVLELIERPDGTRRVSIEPFVREVHSTSFHSGTIRVTDGTEGPELSFE